MNRKDFLIRSGILSAGGLLAGTHVLTSCTATGKYRELSRHTIEQVEFGRINWSWPRFVGKNGRIGRHGQHHQANVVRLRTDKGASGWGLAAYGRDQDTQILSSLVSGKTVDQVFHPDAGMLSEDLRPFDFALHDLAGNILDMPVYEMLGANGPDETKVYSGMIYFDELEPEDNPGGLDNIIKNCHWDYDYGYRQLKVKIGRSGRWYPHDEGLALDIDVIRMIHGEFGNQINMLVDANDAYTLQDSLDFLKGIEDIPLYWIEEPFVENYEEGRQLKEWMKSNGRNITYYADGERNPDVDVCMQLGREGWMDVYLADIVGLGFTPWRKLMPALKEMGMLSSPHGWGTLFKTHYITHLSAGLGNVCTIEGATITTDDVDLGNYEIADGKIRVSGDPGFGMKLIHLLKD
jgi:L-alanine-DL-glutamate epimerase-like enolase superfamily enzyme